MAVAVGISDMSQVTGDTRHMAHDMCHVTCDMWHVTSDTWHLTLDTWHQNFWGVGIFVSVRLSAHIERFSVFRMRAFCGMLLWRDITRLGIKLILQNMQLFTPILSSMARDSDGCGWLQGLFRIWCLKNPNSINFSYFLLNKYVHIPCSLLLLHLFYTCFVLILYSFSTCSPLALYLFSSLSLLLFYVFSTCSLLVVYLFSTSSLLILY